MFPLAAVVRFHLVTAEADQLGPTGYQASSIVERDTDTEDRRRVVVAQTGYLPDGVPYDILSAVRPPPRRDRRFLEPRAACRAVVVLSERY